MRPNYKIPPGPKPGPWGPTKGIMISMPTGLIESLKRYSRQVRKPLSRIVCDLVANGIGGVTKMTPPAVAYIQRLIAGLSDAEIAECREHLGLARKSSMDTGEQSCPLTTKEHVGQIVSELAYQRASRETAGHQEQHSDIQPQTDMPLEPTEESRKE